jgi:hypothetical protein
MATTLEVMRVIGHDGHLRRYQAVMERGHAHAEPQQKGQEQNRHPTTGPALHGAPRMAPRSLHSKS